MSRTPADQATEAIRARCAALRAVLRIAETRAFETAFDQATTAHREQLILISNPKEMRHWMAVAVGRPMESLSYRRLRDMAKNANVFNYSRMTRDELIAELEKKEHARVLEASQRSG
jgi:hypothetical protein